MATLPQVTQSSLRQMAQDAASMYLREGVALTPSVVKVASAFGRPLTTEHVRRVCEMTYHDVFERSFRDTSGASRVVSFDPPDATKVAAAIRAQHVQTYQDKVASRAAGGSQEMDKAASAQVWTPGPVPNSFSALAASFSPEDEVGRLEARGIMRKTAEATKEAARQLETEIGSLKTAGLVAYQDLGRQVRTAVVNDRLPPKAVLSACETFMKEASVDDETAVDVLADLMSDMLQAGVDLDAKIGSFDFTPNSNHPLAVKVVKVANLRSQRVHREYALEDVLRGRDRVERELATDLFS